MTKISAVIITYNEAGNIGRCLDSLQSVADEIIIVDSFSTDETKQICERYDATFLSKAFEGYSSSKNWGNNQAKFDIILSLDADEALSEELQSNVLALKKNGFKNAYRINRLNFIGDTPLKNGGWYPDSKIRLFNKNYAEWENVPVHETVKLNDNIAIENLKGDILHYSFSSLADHLLTINKYSSLRVKRALEKEKRYYFLTSLLKGKFKFFKMYVLKLGFLDGRLGFQTAINSALRHLVEYGKYKQISSSTISSQTICFFNTTQFWGGGEKWHYEAANAMANKNLNIEFVCKKNSPLSEKLSQTKLTTSNFSTSNLSFINPFKILAIASYFKKNKIKTVVFNGSTDLKTGGLAAFFAGVPNVIYRRGLASAPKNNILNLFLFTSVITKFIVNSKSTLNLLAKNTELSTQKIDALLLYNAVNTEFSIDTTPKNNIFTIGIASRLVEQKGLFYLLDIAKDLNNKGVDFVLKIAGDGPLEKELKAKTTRLGLDDNVVFLGFIKDVSSFMQSLDVYLCTSIFEGFGFSMAEAMLNKKPVIAFDTSSNAEVVLNNETGYIVKPYDISVFSEKVITLKENKTLRDQLGESGNKHVVASFSKEKQNEKLYAFLTAL